MSDTPMDRWASAIKNLRDVTKWIMAAIAGALSLILGGSPLTGLGALGPDPRLLIAVVGAAIGVIALAVAFRSAIDVLRTRRTDLTDFVYPVSPPSRDHLQLSEKLKEIVNRRLPPGINSVKQLVDEQQGVGTQQQVNPDRAAEIRRGVDFVTGVLAFLQVEQLFDRLCRRLVVGVGCAFIGFGAYAWAVNPPKTDPLRTVNEPKTEKQNIAGACALQPDCGAFQLRAGRLVCVAELPSRKDSGSSNSSWDHERQQPNTPAEGRTYVAAPSKPIPLVTDLIKAITDTAKELRQFSPIELAQSAAKKFVESASEELGKDLVRSLFSEDGQATVKPESSMPLLVIVEHPAPPQPKPLISELGPVDVFPFANSSTRLPGSGDWRERLISLVDQVRSGDCKVNIRGFADRRGSARSNLYLSLQRADAVASFLHDRGMPRENISTIPRGAYGDGFETEDRGDLDRNRRVEVRAQCKRLPGDFAHR